VLTHLISNSHTHIHTHTHTHAHTHAHMHTTHTCTHTHTHTHPRTRSTQVAFIDDLNMPQKSPFGFIPPLELLKLWVDNGFW